MHDFLKGTLQVDWIPGNTVYSPNLQIYFLIAWVGPEEEGVWNCFGDILNLSLRGTNLGTNLCDCRCTHPFDIQYLIIIVHLSYFKSHSCQTLFHATKLVIDLMNVGSLRQVNSSCALYSCESFNCVKFDRIVAYLFTIQRNTGNCSPSSCNPKISMKYDTLPF